MVADVRTRAQRRDRWVSWIVIALFLLALILGWVVKALAESRYVTLNEGSVQVRYPEGWIKLDVEPPALVQVADKVTGVRTTLALEQRPLPPVSRPLAALHQALTLFRGQNWMAYRVLGIEESVEIGGRTAMHVTFAYVETSPDPFRETTPVVMSGEDYLIPDGDQVYVFTLTTPESNYAQSQRYLKDFVRSFQK